MNWLYSQPFATKARSSLLHVGSSRDKIGLNESDGAKKPLNYSPWNGSFYFWYMNHLFVYRSRQSDNSYRLHEEITISCVSRSPHMVKELLANCRMDYLKLVQNKTTVFENNSNNWDKLATRAKRPLSTVILDEKVKEMVSNDINAYLDPKARTWYAKRGIPYRRGYLLFGPPGTGKSSLSLAIAGQFDLDIYILNLSSADESSVGCLFSVLPPRCVVLLEDVDVAGGMQSRRNDPKPPATPATPGVQQPQTVSLSTLLNVLDGVASQEGRVLILTTNHIERLDAALIRPGRVDIKIEFRLCDKGMITELFHIVYQPEISEDVPANQNGKREVDEVAKKFVEMVPELEFSPAEILSFLMENRQSPHMAVSNIQGWMATTREENQRVKMAG
jgi:mitochondrial chaperone BCS1